MGAGWHSCYLGQGIKAYSLSCGSLGSQEFWKLGHELQKHLASQMGWTPGNSAQAVSLQTLKGLWEIGRCQALLMAGLAQAGACPLPLQQKGKAEPLQIYSQSSAHPQGEPFSQRDAQRYTSQLPQSQTDRRPYLPKLLQPHLLSLPETLELVMATLAKTVGERTWKRGASTAGDTGRMAGAVKG